MNNTWIKCSERQPKEYQEVVACAKGEDAEKFTARYVDNTFMCLTTYEYVLGVTHWTPLPEDPTE